MSKSGRRIARELAVIVFPQLPKDSDKLEKAELNLLVAKAVSMLSDYAKQCLADADALVMKSAETLTHIEVEHPDNAERIENLTAVSLTTGQLKEQLDLIEHALHLVSEALDIPETVAQCGPHESEVKNFLCRLINTYVEHRAEVDGFIRQARAKWKIERMVSIDRDILRLACTEALFIPDIPINVSISEAVELSHRFADEKAAKFINGILRDLGELASSYRRTGVLKSLEVGETDSQSSTVTTKS